jgi:hypothetical protein
MNVIPRKGPVMTEGEWLASTDPQEMLVFLLRRSPATVTDLWWVAATAARRGSGWERKVRLYACGWSRHFWREIPDERLRNALDITEQYADGLAGAKAFRKARRQAGAAYLTAMASEGQDAWRTKVAASVLDSMSLRFLPGWNPHKDGERSIRSPEGERLSQELSRYQCGLLRDLFGPLCFRSISIDSRVLAWKECTVVKLAQAIYDERSFNLLPILADALEDAGCHDADILSHCRQAGGHVRGCWLVDLILDKKWGAVP